MKTCWIFGALPINEKAFCFKENDFIIAADGGLTTLKDLNITPDLTVGDFDSLGYIPKGDNIIIHPKIKDDTDTLLAIKKGLDNGYRFFKIYGCIGGRLDHTLANIQAASFASDNNATALFYFDNSCMTVIKNSSITFSSKNKGNVSVFALSGLAEGVTESGLFYETDNVTISPDFPLGVSNEFTGKESYISVKNGKLCVIWKNTEDAFNFGGNNG